MNEPWNGTFTALVTPFNADGGVDEERLKALVEFQIDGGVEGLVPNATTGESATLTEEEQVRLVQLVMERVDGRVLVLAGAGGNSTDKVIALAKRMEGLGVDGILSVVPYYNKPTQEGMFLHFSRLADAVSLPVIVYNVPSRTGSNLLPETVIRLAGHGNVGGVKEASGDLLQVMEILRRVPETFQVLSGEDNLTYPILALGGRGVISVVSNEVPVMMSRMVREALAGNWSEARKLHYQLLGLMNANFLETNPIPVKAALGMMGMIEERYRLPLAPMSETNRERLRKELLELELVASV